MMICSISGKSAGRGGGSRSSNLVTIRSTPTTKRREQAHVQAQDDERTLELAEHLKHGATGRRANVERLLI